MSAILIGKNVRPNAEGTPDVVPGISLFKYEAGGVVLRPKHSRIFCGYGGDGGSRGRICKPLGASETCVPGCFTPRSWDSWCDPGSPDAADGWCSGHAWRPEDVGTMLSNHYNRAGYAEMIVDAKAWRDNLPESVEALFYPKHTCAIGSPCMETTKAAHAALLKAYRLTAKDIPLLTLDVRNLEAPFEDTHARGAADGYSSHALWAG